MVPATAGTIRPVLILPEQLFNERDVHLLTSALGHEAAHIARHDYLLNLVYECVSLPLWFHPAIRLVMRRLRQTRELCCDEIVTERLLEPRVYAQSLVQLAGAALPFGRPAATITVGIADADILEERIMSILKYSPARLRCRSALLALAALLFVVPCIAAARFAVHVAIHQPAMAAAIAQAGAASTVPASQSNQAQPAAPEPLKLLTPNGEMTVLTDYRPKVGDILIAGSKRLKITGIDPQGQYSALMLKGRARSGPLTAEAIVKKGDLYVLEQSQYVMDQSQEPHAKAREHAEPTAREKYDGEVLIQIRQLQEQLERAERAAREKPGDESSEQLAQAQERLERAKRAPHEKHAGELSEQEIKERRLMERAILEARAQRQAELVRQAKIPIDQAIQIALRETPGTVVEARLIGERGTVTYFISILRQNGTENETAYVLVNAVDGSSVIKASERKQER